MPPLFGGIEAGGTKFVCAVGSGPQDIRAQVSFPTRQPGKTVQDAVAFFRQAQVEHGPLAALGIGCFWPRAPQRR